MLNPWQMIPRKKRCMYKEQPELVDKIDQALEKAMEYLREEEDKTEILEKASEVLNKGKKIKRSLEIVEEKVNEFEPPEKLMPGSIKQTLEAELVKIEAEMDILTKDYQYLISHDLSKKEGYEEVGRLSTSGWPWGPSLIRNLRRLRIQVLCYRNLRRLVQ